MYDDTWWFQCHSCVNQTVFSGSFLSAPSSVHTALILLMGSVQTLQWYWIMWWMVTRLSAVLVVRFLNSTSICKSSWWVECFAQPTLHVKDCSSPTRWWCLYMFGYIITQPNGHKIAIKTKRWKSRSSKQVIVNPSITFVLHNNINSNFSSISMTMFFL